MFIDTRKILWEYEDKIDMDMTDGMFQASRIIDGVRMYPYIYVEFGKYYLEGEH